VSLLGTFVLFFLLPVLFADLMTASLAKLHMSRETATLLFIAILIGGFINLPVTRIESSEEVTAHPLALLGLDEFFPLLRRRRQVTVIAVNVGGCLIPLAIVLYELVAVAGRDGRLVASIAIATLLNTIVCYYLARPVRGLGIAMPGFIPPLVAAGAALLLAPNDAPPVAFAAGVLGPLIGADLLHLRDIGRIAPAGVASIGGAGSFDGIVLSGILAAYLS
jgi:uncharacterized membrane protein